MSDDANLDIPEPQPWSLLVQDVHDVGPSLRRVSFVGGEGGADLRDLRYIPGQDMAIAVPTDDGSVVRRRYTLRALDRQSGVLDVDFVMHGDGPAARWAASVAPGAVVDVIAPRGKIFVDDEASWHLFAGDDSAIPVTAVMVGALAPGAKASVVLEVGSAEDEHRLSAPPGVELDVRWLHRSPAGAEPSESDLLAEALADVELGDPDAGHAYLAGEFSAVHAMRKTLAERGLPKMAISPKPYWRLGRRNLPHGEPDRED